MKHLKLKSFFLALLLTCGVGLLLAATGMEKQATVQGKQKMDTAYIVTPTLSTQDTIYLKHENTTPKESWWKAHSGDVIISLLELAVALVLGAGVSLLTTRLNNKEERYREKARLENELLRQRQLLITTAGIQKEHDIYARLLEIKNAEGDERTRLLNDFPRMLETAKLDILPPLYELANDMYVYYYNIANGIDVRTDEAEQEFFDRYYLIFTEA